MTRLKTDHLSCWNFVTDGVSFARVKKSCDSPHKLFYANIEKETIEDGEPVILVADFYENRLGE